MRLSNGTCSAPVALRSHSRRKSEEPPRRAQRWRTHKWRCAFSLPHAASRGGFASPACRSSAAKQVDVAGRQAIVVHLGAGSEDGQDSAVHGGVRRHHILIAVRAGWIRARGQFLSKPQIDQLTSHGECKTVGHFSLQIQRPASQYIAVFLDSSVGKIFHCKRGSMAKFLNTSATNYFLEELIKGAKDRLVLISPFLKLNDRMNELLEDKNRLKIDVRIVYGKSELQPQEIEWLKAQSFIRTSFCKNLHAKCYLNESDAIVTSLNLYEFSQINNNEMGILIRREDDAELYKDTYEEAQRIIRISDEVRISMERVSTVDEATAASDSADATDDEARPNGNGPQKLSTSRIAQKHGMKTGEWLAKAVAVQLLTADNGRHYLTPAAKQAGIEFVAKSKFGPYFLWPEDFIF